MLKPLGMKTLKRNQPLKTWVDAVLSFFYPDLCQICGAERATSDEGYVCAKCCSGPSGVRFIVPPYCRRCGLPFEGNVTIEFECSNCRELGLEFSWARAAVAATPLILDVIHRYKYNGAVWFEPFLGELLVRQARQNLDVSAWDYLLPVPLHPLKEREREFNQSQRLGVYLGRALGMAVENRILRRTENTQTQTHLTRGERARNVGRAFALREGAEVEGKRVILIDDVLTTGATTGACARVLLEQGAACVGVWTVARGLWT